MIKTSEHDWLRNDYVNGEEIQLGEHSYPSVEHAYQSLKTSNYDDKCELEEIESVADARHFGSKVKLVDNWDSKKVTAMKLCVSKKFEDINLAKKLIQTGDEEILADLRDPFWSEHLSKILMQVREELKILHPYIPIKKELTSEDKLQKIISTLKESDIIHKNFREIIANTLNELFEYDMTADNLIDELYESISSNPMPPADMF